MARTARGPGSFASGVIVGLVMSAGLIGASLLLRPLGPASSEEGWAPLEVGEPSTQPPEPAQGASSGLQDDYERLRLRGLVIPVQGYPGAKLRDSFTDPRVGHVHGAIDLLAPRGTSVLAADNGAIRRLQSGGRAGIAVYEVDREGRYCFFYAHLDHYALFLHEGQEIRKGDVVGYVGSTGNALWAAPHLHFAIYRLSNPERYWEGTPLNPYAIFASGGVAG
jgi:murein DD-endopeptidase MepM/ murein hydrolase activator NlpD